MPSPYSIEVSSDKAVLMKIHINEFTRHFASKNNESLVQMRAKNIMKTNWLRMKKQFLAYMSK